MKKIIYSAKDVVGNEKHGFIKARSNSEAIRLLTDGGLSNITLHNDVLTAFRRDDLENISDKELDRIAQFELRIRKNGINTRNFLYETFRVNKYLILIGTIIFIWGFFDRNHTTMIIGLLAILSMPALSLWRYRVVSAYDKLLRKCALGDWEEALLHIKKIRPYMNQPEMAFDLDIREACIAARKYSLTEALARVEYWANRLDELPPGLYESRIATLFHAAGDYQGFLDKMREGYLKSSTSPIMIIDLALAEARFGDIEKADLLLSQVNKEEIPPHGLPFIKWVKGIIAKRRKDANAVRYLAEAVSSMSEFGENPAVWINLALCSGTYASALIDIGEAQNAKSLVSNVWKILENHGDTQLLTELSKVLEP